jgi:glycosyltransferase involved in cell wall biosynthesis
VFAALGSDCYDARAVSFEGMRVAVVIPAYNEEALIGRAIREVPAWVDDVVVVDDASRDSTVPRARGVADARVRILSHPVNRGVGAAIATGYRWAFAHGADVAAVMAGDAQMDPADLPSLLAPIAHGAADYVKGNRLAHPGVLRLMPLHRWIGNHVLSFLTRLALGTRTVRDSQCGYTALSRRACLSLDLRAIYPRYGYPNDLCARVVEAGLRIGQTVVRPIYGSERSGITLRTALVRIPALLARIFLRRLARQLPARASPAASTAVDLAGPGELAAESRGAPHECA